MGDSRGNARLLRLSLLSALGIVPLACEDDAAPRPCEQPTPLGNGYERCANGSVHRKEIGVCGDRPPSDEGFAGASVADDCARDSDCSEKPYGYCLLSAPDFTTFCFYGCRSDSDCGAGSVCVCGNPPRCAPATCRSDVDCGEGLRCQVYDKSGGCDSPALACTSADDTCSSDTDCAPGGCEHDGSKFVCRAFHCAVGRPFLVSTEARMAPLRERDDWAAAVAFGAQRLEVRQRAAAAEAWARVGQLEHASVAAFARFALQLLQLGAPPDLVERTTRAMADETRHARLAFGIASALAGVRLGPGELDVAGSLRESSLLDVTRLAFEEGCIGETSAALEARAAAALAAEPALQETLARIADDESEHAELAWRFVAWALAQAPGPVAALLKVELARAVHRPTPVGMPAAGELALASLGILPAAERERLKTATFEEIVRPCTLALLERAAGKLAEIQVLSA